MKYLITFLLFSLAISVHAESDSHITITLENGHKVVGTLLKKSQEKIYLDVAGTIISFDRSQITNIETSEEGFTQVTDAKKFQLYQTGKLPLKNTQTLVEELGSAVVLVKTPSGLGTGWFCNQNGYLVTNNHVIAGETSITVTMFYKDGEGFGQKIFKRVRIIALNDKIDLALLKIEEDIDINYPQLYIGDSDNLKEGDDSFVIGNPYGLTRTTTEGIISNAARNYEGRLYIQTTAPINPGNSGGPLFNKRGEVVGVVNMGMIFSDGLGFAIPSKYVKEFLNHTDSFAYDKDNPNSGTQYMEPPITSTNQLVSITNSEFVKAGAGISLLTISDIDKNGTQDIIVVNNNKSQIDIIQKKDLLQAHTSSKELDNTNEISSSEKFNITSLPVSSRITSLAVGDITEDGRDDILFYGDIDGLAYLEQNEDNTFKSPQIIEKKIPSSRKKHSLKIIDIDNNGKNDIFLLGPNSFSIIKDAHKKESYSLETSFLSNIHHVEFLDYNQDKLTDILFFSNHRKYGSFLRLQNNQGEFIESRPIESRFSGNAWSYQDKDEKKFLTLDRGINRIRSLHFKNIEKEDSRHLVSLSRQLETNGDSLITVGNCDQDPNFEMITVNHKKNEFVLYDIDDTISMTSSPCPKNIRQCQASFNKELPLLFSFSSEEKLFGVSQIEGKHISFPLPIQTSGKVESFQIEKDYDGLEIIIWIEKIDGKYFARYTPVEHIRKVLRKKSTGSVNVEFKSFQFQSAGEDLKESIDRGSKPKRFSFFDINSDGIDDLIFHLSFSESQNLYLGLGDGKYKEIINKQKITKNNTPSSFLTADLDGDGVDEVLSVDSEFLRVLSVNSEEQLHTKRQFNWNLGNCNKFIPYPLNGSKNTFLAVADSEAHIVRIHLDKNTIELNGKIDLNGIPVGYITTQDLDSNGHLDIIISNQNSIFILKQNKENRISTANQVVFNSKINQFNYWNLFPIDLNNDGTDEVLLFDQNKSLFEIHQFDKNKQLKNILRQPLFEKVMFQESSAVDMQWPKELAVEDVDGDGKLDFIFILQDRVAIYFQGDLKNEH